MWRRSGESRAIDVKACSSRSSPPIYRIFDQLSLARLLLSESTSPSLPDLIIAPEPFSPTQMKCCFIPKIVLLFHLTACVDAGIYNATTDANHVAGVYPISGQYGLLNRVLFYVLWIFVFCFGKWTSWKWPILGALAYIMTYSATAAVHALVLAITSNRGLYDLDAVGAWAILSVAATITSPVMWFSNRLRESIYRPVFGFWSTVIGTGCICCIASLLRDYPEEPACWSNVSSDSRATQATLLASPTQLLSQGRFNCSYLFFNTSQPLRNPSGITVVPAVRAFGTLYVLCLASCILTGAFGVLLAVLGCCFVGDRRRTNTELNANLARKLPSHATPKQRRFHRKSLARARKELETGRYQNVSCQLLYLNPIVLLVIVAFNETYILASGPLPSSDPVYAIGQWGPWVTVGLALIAAAINAWYTPRWEKIKSTLDAEQEERLEERRRKAIPQIHLDLESSPLGEDFQALQVSYDIFGDEVTRIPSHLKAQPTSDQIGRGAEDHTDSSFTSVDKPADVVARDDEERTRMQELALASNVIRRCVRVPRARDRLNHIKFDPPFALQPAELNLVSLFVQQYDVVCRAYDDVGKQHDGIIIRDVKGHDWVVQKGILWHRELWERA